jgi:phospholipid/cholesterol/gamma-HCH transport system substrate-binding protein
MNPKVKFTVTLVKLGAATVVAVLLFVIVVNAITIPVQGPTHSYTAEFTDVSGLHVHGDIRTEGVQIGKVNSITLVRENGASIAKVGFSLQKPYQLTDNTVLAVKYQNLTGIRYVDLEAPAQPGRPVDNLTTAQTRPSFDITALFNGLQPVLSTMSTNDINTFTQNAISVLQGDGGGLAPMMDSVQKLADLAQSREQVISTLAANMSHIADSIGGKSPEVMDFMHSVEIPIDRAMTILDKFQKTAVDGPAFTAPIDRLLIDLGLNGEFNVDQLLAHVFSTLPNAAAALRLLPATLADLQLPPLTQPGHGAMGCSHGIAKLPTDVQVLLNGSEVVVCNAT